MTILYRPAWRSFLQTHLRLNFRRSNDSTGLVDMEVNPTPSSLNFLTSVPIKVLKNGFKLTGSKLGITEDFSEPVRIIRQKLWDATASSRDNGSTVHLRYDHVYADNECISNSLVKSSKQSTKCSTLPSNGTKLLHHNAQYTKSAYWTLSQESH